MANKAIKYRLHPTKEQIDMFVKTFGCCRKVWNLMLEDKIAYYNQTGKVLNTTPSMYKKDHPYLKEVDSLALANVQLHLQAAYKNFFRTESIRFPRFKSIKYSKKSYTTNNQNGSIRIEGNKIRLPRIGFVKAVIHRMPNEDWKLKSATIAETDEGKYYASLLFEYERTTEFVSKNSSKSLGIDYAADGSFSDTSGQTCNLQSNYLRTVDKIAKEERILKRRVRGSNNYLKQNRKIKKLRHKAYNQRMDYLHKLSTEIANQYDIVCVDSFNAKHVSYNKKRRKYSYSKNNGYRILLTMLKYKQYDRGHYFVEVERNAEDYQCNPESIKSSGINQLLESA